MRIRTAVGALAVAGLGLGLAACSSGGSGGLPGGISSSSCTVGYGEPDGSATPFFKALSAYESWAGSEGLGGGAPARVGILTLTAGATIDVGSVTVVYYTKGGTEIRSSNVGVAETLTSDQSVSVDDTTMFEGAGPSAASCAVVAWTPGS